MPLLVGTIFNHLENVLKRESVMTFRTKKISLRAKKCYPMSTSSNFTNIHNCVNNELSLVRRVMFKITVKYPSRPKIFAKMEVNEMKNRMFKGVPECKLRSLNVGDEDSKTLRSSFRASHDKPVE